MNINLTADLKETNALLTRLVLAVERAVGITAPEADAKEPEYDPRNPAVTYSDNAALLREEWRAKSGLPEEEEPFL